MIDMFPTPAGRYGQWSIISGLIGWVLVLVGGGLFWAGRSIGDDDQNLASLLIDFGRTFNGLAAVAWLLGVIFAAAGVTMIMNKVPDPGWRWIIIGFVVNGAPMVLVAGYVGYLKVTGQIKF
ncbi:hypothetical protein [Fimbriiglobus ruber]|uniref:Uncharacterized protein n=1 Tax=Fimbriiglobus ruber TaxID=1908690 RepID=A0A225DB21_9BACT|nr:hypothetical protein [Fimbriiglobus ruber]OWK34496.1 hypothetical protein FRUB_10467 [Fimbriiglobus ruber]